MKINLKILLTLLVSTFFFSSVQSQAQIFVKLPQLLKWRKIGKLDDLYKISNRRGFCQLNFLDDASSYTMNVNVKKFMEHMDQLEKEPFHRADRSILFNENNIVKVFDSYHCPHDLTSILNSSMKTSGKLDADAFLKLVRKTECPWASQNRSHFLLIKTSKSKDEFEVLPISIRSKQGLLSHLDIHSSDMIDLGGFYSVCAGASLMYAFENYAAAENAANEFHRSNKDFPINFIFSSNIKILQSFFNTSSFIIDKLSIDPSFRATDEFEGAIFTFTSDLLYLYADQKNIDQNQYESGIYAFLGSSDSYQIAQILNWNKLRTKNVEPIAFPVDKCMEDFIGKLRGVGTMSDISFFQTIDTAVKNEIDRTIVQDDLDRIRLHLQVKSVLERYSRSK